MTSGSSGTYTTAYETRRRDRDRYTHSYRHHTRRHSIEEAADNSWEYANYSLSRYASQLEDLHHAKRKNGFTYDQCNTYKDCEYYEKGGHVSLYRPIRLEYLTIPKSFHRERERSRDVRWTDHSRAVLETGRHRYREQARHGAAARIYSTAGNLPQQTERRPRRVTGDGACGTTPPRRDQRPKDGMETKKFVKFSEVRGCGRFKNVINDPVDGKLKIVPIRELEVALDHIIDKSFFEKEYQLSKSQNPNTNTNTNVRTTVPNGHCVISKANGFCKSRDFVEQQQGNSRFPRPKHLSQVVAALAVSLAPFSAGLGKGYSSPAIASLQARDVEQKTTGNQTRWDFSVTDQEASWVASLSLLGALFGGMMGGLAMRHGRRRVLLTAALPFSLSWLLTVMATSVQMMFFTSFVCGFCCSIVSMVSQVYISEISVPDIRGCLSGVLKIVGHLGVLISFTVGAYFDWQQLAMFISVAPVALFCTCIYIPETPSYLVLCGKEEEAYQSLIWLRGPGSDVMQELATIKMNVLASKNVTDRKYPLGLTNGLDSLITPRLFKPIAITCGLMLFQRFSGAHAFNFYAVPIFRKTFGGMNPHGGAIAVSFVQLLASCLSGLLIDTVGRLPLLITSSVFMSMALAGFGSYAYYEEIHRNQRLHNLPFHQSLGQNDWIPLLCVLAFTVAFSLGMSPISWLLIGELFPLEFRSLGSATATAFSYLCAFVSVKTFVDFQQSLGLHGAFWLYASISVAGLCFVVCCVPETKGKDLDEMSPKNMLNVSNIR